MISFCALQASGYTPLMTAAEYGKEALVKALLESGASKSLQNKVPMHALA